MAGATRTPSPARAPRSTGSAPMERPALEVRALGDADIPELLALERLSFPTVPDSHLWKPGQLEAHVTRFPEGQWVIEHDGRIIGSCTNMRVPYETAIAPHTWHEITGNGYLATHDPRGDALYGTEIMVHPEARRMGIGRTLFNRRFAFVVEHGMRAFITGGRIPGYHQHAHDLVPQEYVDRVCRGDLTDPVLTPDLKWGMTVRGLLGAYLPDPDSWHYATLLVWDNPEWTPPNTSAIGHIGVALPEAGAPAGAPRVGC